MTDTETPIEIAARKIDDLTHRGSDDNIRYGERIAKIENIINEALATEPQEARQEGEGEKKRLRLISLLRRARTELRNNVTELKDTNKELVGIGQKPLLGLEACREQLAEELEHYLTSEVIPQPPAKPEGGRVSDEKIQTLATVRWPRDYVSHIETRQMANELLSLRTTNSALVEENEDYREALEFYANEDNREDHAPSTVFSIGPDKDKFGYDDGSIATNVLAKHKGGEG